MLVGEQQMHLSNFIWSVLVMEQQAHLTQFASVILLGLVLVMVVLGIIMLLLDNVSLVGKNK
jgi:hypothetical protein